MPHCFLSLCLLGCQGINRAKGAPYHFAEINYFIELTTKLQYEKGVRKELSKWNDNIIIGFGGNPREEDIIEVTKIVAEINEILGFEKISMINPITTRSPNMVIHCVSFSEFPKIFPDRTVKDLYHFSLSKHPDKSYKDATILIADSIMNQQSRNSAFRATITRSLGLVNTSKRFQYSIFNPSYNRSVTHYNEMDKEMIKLLYRDEIEIGMDHREIRVAIENIAHN